VSLDDFDLYDDLDVGEARPRDAKIDEAKAYLIENIFGVFPRETFYERQVQVMAENEFYHWITSKALHELALESAIQTEKVALGEKTFIRFIFPIKTATGNARPQKFGGSFSASRLLNLVMPSGITPKPCLMRPSRSSDFYRPRKK
jgi:hypothetical protein